MCQRLDITERGLKKYIKSWESENPLKGCTLSVKAVIETRVLLRKNWPQHGTRSIRPLAFLGFFWQLGWRVCVERYWQLKPNWWHDMASEWNETQHNHVVHGQILPQETCPLGYQSRVDYVLHQNQQQHDRMFLQTIRGYKFLQGQTTGPVRNSSSNSSTLHVLQNQKLAHYSQMW